MSNLKVLVVSSSLNPKSRSRVLAEMAQSKIGNADEVEVSLYDLQEKPLPLCDGGSVYELPEVVAGKEMVEAADAIVFASPIYVYGVNAALKNFVELYGHSMHNKMAGFICAAGGPMSYMAVMGMANSLMLDFRMIILPRFLYVAAGDWNEDTLSEELAKRLDQFSSEFVSLGKKLNA